MTNEQELIPYEAVTSLGSGNILVLAPHPDDEVFGCAGAIMRHLEAGDSVRVIIVTDGGYREPGCEWSQEEYIRIRKAESLQAGKILGYTPEFWNLPDRNLPYGEKLVSRLAAAIEKQAANLVYAPSFWEIHPDHRSLGLAAAEAVRRHEGKIELVFYEIGSPLRPNRLLDISSLVARKQEAVNCFASQLQQRKYDQFVTALNRFRTYTLPDEVQAAEAYYVISREKLLSDPEAMSLLTAGKIISVPEMEPEPGSLVTVIIRSMDRKKLLAAALNSVALQTYPRIEVLVINAKGEGHAELEPWCGRFPLRLLGKGRPLTRSQAANLGLENAHGDYLLFLDDDDLFDAEHVAGLVNRLQSQHGVLAAYAGVRVHADLETPNPGKKVYNDPFDPVRLLCHNYLPIHAVLFRRELVDQGCRFDENLDLCEDWDFWIQVSRKTALKHLDRISATYRLSSSSSNLWQDEKTARDATLKIFRKWVSRWTDEELFTIACRAAALPDYEKQAQQFRISGQQQEAEIAKLHQTVQTLIQQRDTLGAEHHQLATQNAQLAQELEELKTRQEELVATMAATKAAKEQLAGELRFYREELEKTLNSKSWKLTAPLRGGRRFASTRIVPRVRPLAAGASRYLWHHLPWTTARKQTVKNFFFSRFPRLFSSTRVYQNWQRYNHPETVSPASAGQPGQVSLRALASRDQREHLPPLDEPPYTSCNIRALAFYLPQFHPIPENDAWWGPGFTEWTNVRAATPQFTGHYQPHIPGELGYYDLVADPTVMARQIALARQYGLAGFCFYFYWFGGKRLLETPLLYYREHRELDFPFCLCWANENWSRRWDGLDNEILIGQQHSPADDLEFIAYLEPYLRDHRYIRIQGKPLLLVYRPELLPAPRETAARWRQWCRDHGLGEIYLAYTQSFEKVNPEKYGFDAAIEFPPNRAGIQPLKVPEAEKGLLRENFSGFLYDLDAVAARSRRYDTPAYRLFRGVCPSWDNTARRREQATIFLNSSPRLFREWLYNAARDTIKRFPHRDERLIFINAWNEWAEGTHLEPDQEYGHAYLRALREALVRADAVQEHRRLLLVAHDAHPHGAQNLILHLAKVLSEEFYFAVEMVVLGEGPLTAEYARYATIHSLAGKKPDGPEAQELAAELCRRGIKAAVCNTTVTGIFAQTLKKQGLRVVSLIHELPNVIKNNRLQPQVRAIAASADVIVFPARQVEEGFTAFAGQPLAAARIRPQGLYKKNPLAARDKETNRRELRQKLGLDPEAEVVLAVAFGDHRKGVDLFVDAGLAAVRSRKNLFFLWVGRLDETMKDLVAKKLAAADEARHFLFPGPDFQTDLYYAGADLYALTSREDPFPSVVLEALDAATPVVAFAGTGGCCELLSRRDLGRLAPAFDTDAYAREIISLLAARETRRSMGIRGREIIAREFSFRHYLFDLLEMAGAPIKKVSAIVPNYNYARYLEERIFSIARQTYPVYEIIVLDDASTDDSIALLSRLLPELPVDATLVTAEDNSGRPCRQWLKGVEMARGDYIWIAEADDAAAPEFLAEVMKAFSDPQVVLSYCQSRQMNADGEIIAGDYLDYVADISRDKWLTPHTVAGSEEGRTALAVKNTIPNVSAVVFARAPLLTVLRENIDEIAAFRVAGDWITYLLLLREGKIAFSPRALNDHRRHQQSVTLGSFNLAQLQEILAAQRQARELFHPDPETVLQARKYVRCLYEEFGLAGKSAPRPEDHPELRPYLANDKQNIGVA